MRYRSIGDNKFHTATIGYRYRLSLKYRYPDNEKIYIFHIYRFLQRLYARINTLRHVVTLKVN